MGYANFPELRLALKQQLQKRANLIKQPKDDLSLEETYFPADFDEKIYQLIEILDQSNFIHCLGNGASGIMAQYAQQRFSSLGYRSISSLSNFIPYLSTKNEKRDVPINEVCLLFSVSGETNEVVHLAQALKETGIYSVSITNKENNTLANLCDFSLSYDAPSNRHSQAMDMSSQLPVVYIIEALANRLYLKTYSKSSE